MSSHQNQQGFSQKAASDGLVIHLANLHFKAKKAEIEKLLRDQGFQNCVFHWPKLDKNVAEEHKGWCRVEFADQAMAAKARETLPTVNFRGRKLKIGQIPTSSVCQCPC